MTGPLSSGPLSRLMVYDGQVAIGEVEDHGDRDIIAFQLTATGRVRIGTFPTRREAMRAVSVNSPNPPNAA
jgi:hypothetical protein